MSVTNISFQRTGVRGGAGPLISDRHASLDTVVTIRLQVFLFAILFLLAQVSCGSEPAVEFRFLSSDDVPPGKAVVYVYRPPSLLGTVGVCNMNVGSELIGSLDAAHYTHLFVEPGKSRIETVGSFHAFVTVNLKAGGEYFIRQTWVLSPAGYRPRIDNMTKVKAESDLRRCTFVERPPAHEERTSNICTVGIGEDGSNKPRASFDNDHSVAKEVREFR